MARFMAQDIYLDTLTWKSVTPKIATKQLGIN